MLTKSLIKKIAKTESVSAPFLQKQLDRGRVVIPLNRKHNISSPTAIGEGLRVKINTNLGLSTNEIDISGEMKKMKAAVASGADTIMDLSVSENLHTLRKKILSQCPVPVGTVPIYEAALDVEKRKGAFEKMTFDDVWDVLKKQAEDGVDFFTIHAGILKSAVTMLKRRKRVGGIVSRGGSILARWMLTNKKENFLYDNFDRILDLAKEYNITMSLGDALRPGAIADSTDDLQLSELRVLGQLVKRCRKRGVQAMVEGPGHIRLDEIPMNVALEKKLCHNAPFYVLGPLPVDIAAGHDHITAAIGGTIAAFYGADFLCVVTPAEHLRHPTVDDIKDGTIASKIAASSVNAIRFKEDLKRNELISLHRARRDWNKLFPLTIDEEKARKYRKHLKSSEDICTMCGRFCSLKIAEDCKLLK